MQNSKLSKKILPELSKSWRLFIQKVESELRSLKATNTKNSNRVKELEIHLQKLEEMKKVCSADVRKIYNYRAFLSYFNTGLKRYLDGLDLLEERDNLDNDAVGQLYNDIINNPVIVSLNKEYNKLLPGIKTDESLIKQYEELVNGEKLDQKLIQKLLDKFELDEKIKKDILLYSFVISVAKDKTESKEDKIAKTINKAEELIKLYNDKTNEYQDLLFKCYDIYKQMSEEEIVAYDSLATNLDQLSLDAFNNLTLLKIYVMAIFKIKSKIDGLIETMKDLMMDKVSLNKENKCLEELINRYIGIMSEIDKLMLKYVENYDKDFFLALNVFKMPFAGERILLNNRELFEKYIPMICDNSILLDLDVEIKSMDDVDTIEDYWGKRIYLLKTIDFKLPYVMVGNKVLVLGMASINDSDYDDEFVYKMKRNIKCILDQIKCIEENDKNYLGIQMELINSIFGSKEK